MLAVAIVLGWLWTTLEHGFFSNRHMAHWPFLILWAAFLPLIYQHRFRVGLHLALVALLWWSLYAFGVEGLLWDTGSKLYLVQVYLLAYLAVFLLGMLFATFERLADFARPAQRYGIFAALVCAYALTSPYIQSGQWGQMWGDKTLRAAASGSTIAATVVALALVTGLALWHRRRTGGAGRAAYLHWGQGLIGAIVLLMLANLFLGGVSGGWVAIAFNLLFFAGLLWLIYAGMYSDDRFLVNLAFVFFGLTLLTRYFDTFWTLLNRSFFFMAGGLLLIAGGYALERKRRQITAGIGARREGGAA
jgi:uncharacterized membrane protein